MTLPTLTEVLSAMRANVFTFDGCTTTGYVDYDNDEDTSVINVNVSDEYDVFFNKVVAIKTSNELIVGDGQHEHSLVFYAPQPLSKVFG